MNFEIGGPPRKATGAGLVLAVGLTLFAAPSLSAQASAMNFFVAPQGPSYGANLPAVAIGDAFCQDTAYAEGFGALTWHIYLDGTQADGEADQVARERIGPGPWINYRGAEIASDLAQLHSDNNNLTPETALTVFGRPVPDGVLQIPPGSEMDGGDFTRQGPFFCFGLR